MKIGQTFKGRITGIQPYGAFVELENGQTGLIHISEIKTGYVENIYDTVKLGQKVLVQVVDVDEYTQKASLSLRTLEEASYKLPRRHRFTNEHYKTGFAPLKASLPQFIAESKQYLGKKQA